MARDQVRDQIADRRRLSRPAPSQAERRIEIRGTYCNGSGHLGRGRRVETQRSHLGPGSQVSECHPQVVGKLGADGVIVLSSSSQVRDGGRKAIPLRNNENHVCAGSERPPRVPAGRSLSGKGSLWVVLGPVDPGVQPSEWLTPRGVGHRAGLGHRALYRELMDDEATTDISCPTCSAQMDAGWVAMWNPIVFQKVRWQSTEPGYVRLRVPEGARVILAARAGGKGGRVAMLCPSCATIVMPPDATYN